MSFTAKIISKSVDNGVPVITVEFSDGTSVIQESCRPQDLNGLKQWAKSRISTFESRNVIDSTFVLNSTMDLSDPVVTPPVLTQAEIDRNNWLTDYRTLVKAYQTLVVPGIIGANNPTYTALMSKVQSGLKASYLDFI